ncbi:hypothetical protein K1W69_19195 [Hoeflea sp. WL0058]|uniref:Carboxymuconolactone decarboxylase family protein n=1 Tax=Flavimaribacter sediminis TaxID=2865987 RepID=A0AAE2ZNP5_9HYPH|nr:hypothetical protein [Flavimaribacter sediminis]MBW8639329.1 hypothetical protein [Flavimaribacter sediminis]
MIRRFLDRSISRFSNHYDYDASYMREILDESTAAGLQLAMSSALLQGDFGVSKEAFYAAKIRSVMRADCGPCLRLAMTMAEESGLSPDAVLPALGHGEPTEDAALAIRFADAVLDNSADLAETVEEARKRFGERARIGLAVAVLAGQFYPLLKRGMGHAATCESIVRDYIASNTREEFAHAAE